MANSLIDFGVVQPEAAGSFLRGFQGAQALAQQQAAQQQQNALIDLQLRAAQRGEEEALAEREAYRRAGSMTQVPQELMAAGLGKQSMAAQEALRKQRADTLKIATDTNKFIQHQLRGVIALGTRESANQALARAEAMGLDVSLERAQLEQIPDSEIKRWAFTQSEGAAKALEQAIIQLPGGGTAIEPKYAIPGAQAPVAAAPVAPMAAPAMPAGIPGQTPPTRAAGVNALALPAPGVGPMAQGAMPTPTGGRYFPPAMTPQQKAAEIREQERISLEQRRVELAEKEAARKEAGLAEPLSKQEIQKREAIYPQMKSSVNGFEAESNNMIKKLQQLKEHKGLDGILGTVYGRTPSLTKESQAAQALYDQVMAKGKFQELQNMRLASPTGGALGNVSNMEIQSLGQAFGALSRIQGKESFQAAIDDVIKQIESSKKRTREAFDETYQYKQGKQPAAPAEGGIKFLGFE